jgi:uncharacterized protein
MSTDPAPSEYPYGTLTPEERQWGMFAHLSILIALWAGFIFLGPLIIWLIKKDQSRFVDDQGKEALNFSLNVLLLTIAGVLFGFVTVGFGFLLVAPLLVALGVLSIVMPIIAGMKANAGEAYRYPCIIRIVT